MPRTNAIIDTLEKHPSTNAELPYRNGLNMMSFENRRRILKIKVIGSQGLPKYKCGCFLTVYYLKNDEDRAAEHFVKVNFIRLQKIELTYNNVLSRQIEKTMLKKIWETYVKNYATLNQVG